MTLISSISGIRGTVGGSVAENLTPIDAVKFASAFATYLRRSTGKKRLKIILGRDGRYTGYMYQQLIEGTLLSCGADVICLGQTTTPTIEMAVLAEKADGAIIITASHNPAQWNALKLLNHEGEFIDTETGKYVLNLYHNNDFDFVSYPEIGTTRLALGLEDPQVLTDQRDYTKYHIRKILSLDEVLVDAIRKARFRVAVDYCTSANKEIISRLFEALGVEVIWELKAGFQPDFIHNPEPLPENLGTIQQYIKSNSVDLGIVVDPDADRLCFLCEDGSFFGEEYTLVAVADYILKNKRGAVVSNLSSTRALLDVAEKHGCSYFASAVGEVNVVSEMKRTQAVIGGEGNGGIIFPTLHYGRDALVGIALFLSHLATVGGKVSQLRKNYPTYHMVKDKLVLSAEKLSHCLSQLTVHAFQNNYAVNTTDGVKISFDDERKWIHIRPSNTEPIVRMYTEAPTLTDAQALVDKYKSLLSSFNDA